MGLLIDMWTGKAIDGVKYKKSLHRKISINGEVTIYPFISTPGKSAPFWKTSKNKAYYVKKVLILFYHFVIFRRLHMAASESFSGFHFGFTSL